MSNLSIKIAEMSKDFPTIKAIRQVVFRMNKM